MKLLCHPVYLPNIALISEVIKAESLVLESHDNFQKQTYRNRTHIYAANGKLQLNIPVRHSQKNRQLYKDVKIAYDTDWQLIHRRSIESAYRTSPFYEFYEDEIMPLFETKEKYLFDFNLKSMAIVFGCLQEEFDYKLTDNFKKGSNEYKDIRKLVDAKSGLIFDVEEYRQVFSEKHGFISNLSILDLICNLGPESVSYLKRQPLLSV